MFTIWRDFFVPKFAILRYASLQRYPVLFGLLMIVLGPVAIMGFPKRLLGNVFLVHNLRQTATLTIVCFCMATVLAAQFWIVYENGPSRFKDLQRPDWSEPRSNIWSWSIRGTLLWLIVALAMPVSAVWHSWETRTEAEKEKDPIARFLKSWTTSAIDPLPALNSPNPAKADIADKLFPTNVNITRGVMGLIVGTLLSFLLLLFVSIMNIHFGFDVHVIEADGKKTKRRSLLPLDGIADFILGPGPPPKKRSRASLISKLAFIFSGPRIQPRGEPKNKSTEPNGYAYTDYEPGTDEVKGSYFEDGHMQLGLFVFCLVGIYIAFLWESPASERALRLDQHWFGTSFFLVIILLFAVNALSAAAFLCDGFRLPPVMLVGAVLALLYLGLDHTFQVTHPSTPVALVANTPAVHSHDMPAEPSLPDQIYDSTNPKPHGKDDKKYLIVITAPGGGIHAAGWTSQVLTGLHRRYGPDFSRSIGLISAVSGGSVGAMHYANSFEQLNDPENFPNQGDRVVADACSSSLEAVGWGLAYEDLPRLLGLRSAERDRTRVVEELWNSQLKLRTLPLNQQLRPPPNEELNRIASATFSDWAKKRAAGTCPPLVFNATEIESGRRVLFGNFELPRSLQELKFLGIDSRQFAKIFPNSEIEVATAARLSATFPYVFPAAKHQIPFTRKEDDGTKKRQYGFGHVVDGGYSDNEGILTAVEVIKDLLQKNSSQPADRQFNEVLLIRIQHHAVKKQSQYHDRAPIPVSGSRAAFAGPMQAVLAVRDASQVERAAIETDLLRQMEEESKFPIRTVYLEFVPADLVQDERKDAIVFDGHENHGRPDHDCQLSIVNPWFKGRERSRYQAPLSWKLSPQEFEQYRKCWQAHEQKAVDWAEKTGPRPALALLDDFFEPLKHAPPKPANRKQ